VNGKSGYCAGRSCRSSLSLSPTEKARDEIMVRSARRYDIYLPLTDNSGRPIPDQIFHAIERQLVARFGGLTSQQRDFPLRGIWQGETRLYLDQVIVVTALDFRPQGSTRFIAKLKRELLRELDQLEVLITEQPLRVH
jgi:hypothetical protein